MIGIEVLAPSSRLSGRSIPDLVRVLPDVFELPLDTWVAMHENLKSSLRCRVTFDALTKGLLDYVRG